MSDLMSMAGRAMGEALAAQREEPAKRDPDTPIAIFLAVQALTHGSFQVRGYTSLVRAKNAVRSWGKGRVIIYELDTSEFPWITRSVGHDRMGTWEWADQ